MEKSERQGRAQRGDWGAKSPGEQAARAGYVCMAKHPRGLHVAREEIERVSGLARGKQQAVAGLARGV